MQTTIIQYLRDYFPDIKDSKLQEAIANEGKIMKIPAHTTMITFGDYIRFVPLVIKGSIRVMREGEEADQQLLLYYLNGGETCSMSFTCCMERRQSDIETVTEEETLLVAIPIEKVDSWMEEYRNWKSFVMRSYDQRLRTLIKTIDNIAFQKMDSRLLKYLQEKAKLQTNSIIVTTHSEIARDLNASREAVSRLLKQLEKQSVLKLGRNRIEMC